MPRHEKLFFIKFLLGFPNVSLHLLLLILYVLFSQNLNILLMYSGAVRRIALNNCNNASLFSVWFLYQFCIMLINVIILLDARPGSESTCMQKPLICKNRVGKKVLHICGGDCSCFTEIGRL